MGASTSLRGTNNGRHRGPSCTGRGEALLLPRYGASGPGRLQKARACERRGQTGFGKVRRLTEAPGSGQSWRLPPSWAWRARGEGGAREPSGRWSQGCRGDGTEHPAAALRPPAGTLTDNAAGNPRARGPHDASASQRPGRRRASGDVTGPAVTSQGPTRRRFSALPLPV